MVELVEYGRGLWSVIESCGVWWRVVECDRELWSVVEVSMYLRQFLGVEVPQSLCRCVEGVWWGC